MALGPLVRDVDGVWMLGDRERKPRGSYVRFLPGGAEHWLRGVRQPLVPWSRFMLLLAVGPMVAARTRIGPRLVVTLRHPYLDWEFDFTRHRHRYSGAHMLFLNELLSQLSEAREAKRLADPDWLARVVDELAPKRTWTAKALRAAVTEARASADRWRAAADGASPGAR